MRSILLRSTHRKLGCRATTTAEHVLMPALYKSSVPQHHIVTYCSKHTNRDPHAKGTPPSRRPHAKEFGMGTSCVGRTNFTFIALGLALNAHEASILEAADSIGGVWSRLESCTQYRNCNLPSTEVKGKSATSARHTARSKWQILCQSEGLGTKLRGLEADPDRPKPF